MLDIQFEIDGKPVNPNNIADALERAMFDTVADGLRKSLGSVRDPDTGEFPTVVVRGRTLDTLSIHVEGSEAVVALAEERLSEEFEPMESTNQLDTEPIQPHVFLCHASEDKSLARKIAVDLHANGIKVFFDEWSIEPGDSIRQRIDEGLSTCTHFVVLITSSSLEKPWVNAEIDAGFVRKLSGLCRFVPLRIDLDATDLPPLLATLHSPALNDYEQDIRALVGFFFGVSQVPPPGSAAEVIDSYDNALGISPAAKRIVDMMMEHTKHGIEMDPQLDAEMLQQASNLTHDEIVDAVYELEGRGLVVSHRGSNAGPLGFIRVVPEAALFVAFDEHYHDWNPEEDSLRLAAELMNRDEDGERLATFAGRLGWKPRRMNPAVAYLIERDLVRSSDAIGTGPWCTAWIRRTDATRRFVTRSN